MPNAIIFIGGAIAGIVATVIACAYWLIREIDKSSW